MHHWSRWLASGIVLVHLLAMAGSAVPGLDALRAWTLPWEKVLGVHQTWPMFVNPERGTVWLRVVGSRADGTEIVVPDLSGEPSGVIWTYDRRGKLVRNASAGKREYLRTAIVRWACRQDASLRKVSVQRLFQPTLEGPRSSWPVRVREDAEWNCAR